MKIVFWLLPVVVLIGIGVRFWLQRRREQKAQKDGVVVYATVVSIEPVTVFRKPSPVMKINMWIQEPGASRREVSLSSRIPAGQNVGPGVMLPVVVDPSDPKKIYPAGPDAVKRVQLTGSRDMRRRMRQQGL
jgi:hypothetical protein